MSTSVFEGTPSVTVVDSRGLIIRDINFCRTVADGNAEIRITRHQYNSRGALTQSIDPRLYEFQQQDPTVKANVTYLTSLDGTPLRTASVDAGTTIAIKDAADRPVVSINANGVVRSWLYETSTLAGRLLNISEKPATGSAIVRERFIWADVNTSTQNWNLAGTCVRHYDPAGMNEITSIALTGSPLSISRQLLLNNSEANWPDGAESVWRALLQSEKLITQSTLDATGALLNQTDAKGNQQSQAYDVAGQLKASWMTLMGGTKQVILASLTYSAAGQKLREEHGNGVVTSYRYEPQTQRLLAIKTERPTGHQEGAKVLQDLQYSYDPVGNIVNVSNGTEATKFWLNQVIKPENSYSYDSLYQLIRATGREMANAAQQSSDLPQAGSFDNATYTNYTRTYRYDTAGNLTQISHSALASYTQSITVSDRSNRAVLSTLTDKPSEVDALFTLGGEQKQLHNGKPSTGQQSASQLSWTSRGELMKVILVKRVGDTDDSESYQYDSASQRIVKSSTQKTAGTTQIQRAVYLPGLELRSTSNGVTETKKMHIIAMGEAGRAQVRLLHWDIGQPANITNNQLRYSYDNLIGSTTLEVDSRGLMISQEEYYPYGGTAVLLANSQSEVDYKTIRYSGKERDLTGLYYYGYRYYQPWVGRWLSADPMGSADGLNLFCMVQNNPIMGVDENGLFTLNIRKLLRERAERKVEQRANRSYQHMNDGAYWRRQIRDKETFDNISTRNLNYLKQYLGPLRPRERDFVERFKQLDFNLVHFSNADLIHGGKAEFRSRIELIKKRIIFPTANTQAADIDKLATDDFAFFSLNVGGASGKSTSRFGNKRYDTNLRGISNYKYLKYSHVAINDTLLFDQRQTSLARLQTKFSVADATKLKNQPVAAHPLETIYSYKDFREGLALNIVRTADRLSARGRNEILNTRSDSGFDDLISLLYRPQFLVPKKMVSKNTLQS